MFVDGFIYLGEFKAPMQQTHFTTLTTQVQAGTPSLEAGFVFCAGGCCRVVLHSMFAGSGLLFAFAQRFAGRAVAEFPRLRG